MRWLWSLACKASLLPGTYDHQGLCEEGRQSCFWPTSRSYLQMALPPRIIMWMWPWRMLLYIAPSYLLLPFDACVSPYERLGVTLRVEWPYIRCHSELSSSPGLYLLASSSFLVFITNLDDRFRSRQSDCSLPLRNLLNFLRGFPSVQYLPCCASWQGDIHVKLGIVD